MLTKPGGQSRSKTLKAPLTWAGVYEVFTLRDITVTNSAGSTAGTAGRQEGRAAAGQHGVQRWRALKDAARDDAMDGRRTVKVNLAAVVRIDLGHHLVELLLRARRGPARQHGWRCGGQKESAPCSPDSA